MDDGFASSEIAERVASKYHKGISFGEPNTFMFEPAPFATELFILQLT